MADANGGGEAERASTLHALQRLTAGDPQAASDLLPLVYDQLRRLAARYMQRGPEHTLQPTAVVHEAYMKMVGANNDWRSKAHFQAVAAKAMRQVLIDRARRRGAVKRGEGIRNLTIDEALRPAVADQENAPVDILDLEEALAELERLRPRHARLVELRFFGGLSMKESAEALQVSLSSVEKDWAMARAWLMRALADGTDA